MYTVRIAFTVPPSTKIGEDEVCDQVGTLEVSLKFAGEHYTLEAIGFPSTERAADFLTRLDSALCWLLLKNGISAEAALEPQTINYYSDPQLAAANLSKSLDVRIDGPVDGMASGTEAAIYLTDKRLRFATFGRGSAYTTVPSRDALQTLLEGLRFKGAHGISQDPKLGVALKLYGAYFTEQSSTARFLTLIMSLEALTLPTPKAPIALALLEKWSIELDEIAAPMAPNSEDALALAALKREICFRRDDSIRSQVRKLVLSTLDDESDAADVAREALRLYDLRSTLVHDGFVDARQLSEATDRARTLVHRVLLSRFRRVTH